MTTIINLDSTDFEEGALTVDTTALSELVKDAFLLSMDERVPDSVQGALQAYGTTLRLQLRHLLGVVFDQGTEKVVTANEAIKKVNRSLKEAKQRIDRVADIVEGLGGLVKQLDGLLSIAGLAL